MKYTGAGDPAWTYSKNELSKQIFSELPAAWPYAAADFKRVDEEDDSKFYPEAQPKLVYHVDEGAVAALTRYYEALNLKRGADVLDICSSWVSHYPKSWPKLAKSIVGTGISATELACNDQLSSFVARDLNNNPALPFADTRRADEHRRGWLKKKTQKKNAAAGFKSWQIEEDEAKKRKNG